MEVHHDKAPELLPELRVYLGLKAALEASLHQHIHLENNVLFPRALAR